MNRNISYFSGPSFYFYSLTQTSLWFGIMSLPPDRGKFGYGIILSPDRIVIFKFGLYGETKSGAASSRQNIILNDSHMKTGIDIYMDI